MVQKSKSRTHFAITFAMHLLVTISQVSCHKCYVCGPTLLDFRQSCDQMNMMNQNQYIEDCPSKYRGCSTQIQGNTVIRQCEELQITDCKFANNVKYCYCASKLCNSISLNSITADDEDMFDGSGNFEMSTEDNTIQRIIPANNANKLGSTLTCLATCLLLQVLKTIANF